MAGKVFFITGTGTQIGKSVVTGMLAKFLKSNGKKVITQKWVQSGGKFTEDVDVHWKWMGGEEPPLHLMPLIVPYHFEKPASPHLSARLEHAVIDTDYLIETPETLRQDFDYVLVEGSGGVMVPVTDSETWLDVLKKNPMPVIVVTENTLGCINHTLMTVEVLKAAGLPVFGIVYNQLPTTSIDEDIQRDNVAIITKMTGVEPLAVLGVQSDVDSLEWSRW
jgi:dethiobiotin synthetase